MSLDSELHKIRTNLLLKASLEEFAAKERGEKSASAEYSEKIAKGLRDVPVNKMLGQIQYIENNLLKRLEKRGGKGSADYLFFSELVDTIKWSLVLADRYETLMTRLTYKTLENQINRENLLLFEKELQKFTTLEELFLTDGLATYAKGVQSRLDALLKGKK